MGYKITVTVTFTLLLIFFLVPSGLTAEGLTILYTGDTDGRVVPVFQ